MLAKNDPAAVYGPQGGAVRQWTRKATTFFLLIASVAAWGLIVHDRYGAALQERLANALPLDLLRSPAAPAEQAPMAATETRADPNEARYRVLAEFLARRYRVSQDATLDLVSFAYAAGHQIGLDPLLIIAVIAVESRFNPIAESVAGAKGLMQVIPKYHADKLQEHGGVQAVFDPRINILVGSQILKEYERRAGSTTAALQMYAGAAGDLEDTYSTKVIAEKKRLQSVVKQSKSPSIRIAQTSALDVDAAK